MISATSRIICRGWYGARGFFASRRGCSRVWVDAQVALTRAAELTLELSSLRATVRDRENEIARLEREKAQVESERDLRVHEVEELNKWLERVHTRLDADIAQEVARGQRALAPPRPTREG